MTLKDQSQIAPFKKAYSDTVEGKVLLLVSVSVSEFSLHTTVSLSHM